MKLLQAQMIRKRALTCRYGTQHTVGTGKGVTIYTLDSGLRISHQEFQAWDKSGSRASNGCGPPLPDSHDIM